MTTSNVTVTTTAPSEPLHSKYAAAILSAITVVGTALATALGDKVDWSVLLQLAIVAAGAVGTYVVPVLPSGWRGGGKVGVAILAALLTAAVPFVGGWTAQAIVLIVLAGVQAAAVHLGVAIRLDGQKATGA